MAFGVELDQIQVVVHPQSIVHSMVEYEDGAVIAQLGVPDMKVPIQYALTYPKRVPNGFQNSIFLKKVVTLLLKDQELKNSLVYSWHMMLLKSVELCLQ